MQMDRLTYTVPVAKLETTREVLKRCKLDKLMAGSGIKLEDLALSLVEQVTKDHSMISATSIEITVGHG
jgi:hypothetical protein